MNNKVSVIVKMNNLSALALTLKAKCLPTLINQKSHIIYETHNKQMYFDEYYKQNEK